MREKFYLFIGTFLLVTGLYCSYLLLANSNQAKLLDGGSYLPSRPDPCSLPLSDVQLSRTVIAIKESVSLTVILSNNESQECNAKVTVIAPTFEKFPPQETKEINVPPGKNTASLVWVLIPKEQGLHSIGIQSGLMIEAKGLSVTNILGLTPKQAQIVSYIGTFLGSPITLAGLYHQWTNYQAERKRRQEEEKLKAQESQKKTKKSFFSFINRFNGRS